jgi:hypothetical protein
MTCQGTTKLGKPAPFGEILGYNHNVPAYSCDYDNGGRGGWCSRPKNVECFGAPWQCVEYARRWLIKVTGHAFDDVGACSCISLVACYCTCQSATAARHDPTEAMVSCHTSNLPAALTCLTRIGMVFMMLPICLALFCEFPFHEFHP